MSLKNLDGLIWVLGALLPLLALQRVLHHEIRAIFLLITRRNDLALMLFALLFLPGVLLHEGSHYLMARLLGVATGRFSIVPRPLPNGRLQLGFVETGQADLLRDALIGVAPLLSGGLFVAYAGLTRLGLAAVWDALGQGSAAVLAAFGALPAQPDFWLWFYLAFAVSSTMLPSESDRQAWQPLGLAAGALIGLALLAGAGPWMLENLAPILNAGLRAAAVVFGISMALHGLLALPLWGLRRLISALTGYQVSG